MAFDLVEQVEALLVRIERAKYDPAILADQEWLTDQKHRLQMHSDQLKHAAMKERR